MIKQYILSLSKGETYHYHIRHSKRAKRLSLTLSARKELTVVLPIGMERALAHEFVQKKSNWVEKHLSKAKLVSKSVVLSKPNSLHLKMLDEIWTIHYVKGNDKQIQYHELPQYHLQITGGVESSALIHKVLGRFLKNKADAIFSHSMQKLAQQHGFSYSAISIRGQKTRWGSCSKKQSISLNYKLLLMPKLTAHYVFIHELCHTLEMSHSKRFWQLVERCDPNYHQHEQYLKEHGAIIRYF